MKPYTERTTPEYRAWRRAVAQRSVQWKRIVRAYSERGEDWYAALVVFERANPVPIKPGQGGAQ